VPNDSSKFLDTYDQFTELNLSPTRKNLQHVEIQKSDLYLPKLHARKSDCDILWHIL